MTDDLVKRLREDQPVTQDMTSTLQCALQDAAADRIEALEAKLAKAVDLGCELANCGEYGMHGWDVAAREWDAFTAELTGGKDD